MGQTQDMLERKGLSASWEHFGVALEVLEVVALDSEASASPVGLLSWISSRKLTEKLKEIKKKLIAFWFLGERRTQTCNVEYVTCCGGKFKILDPFEVK